MTKTPVTTASSSETNAVSSASDYIAASVTSNSCPVVDEETLNSILAEIKSLKDALQSQNEKNEEKFTGLNMLISNSKDHLVDLMYSINGNVSAVNNSSTDVAVEVPEHTGEIFKSAEINLNEGQGYYLADIVKEENLSKYSDVRFYFSRCGFIGYFSIPTEKCFDGTNLSPSDQVSCSNVNKYTNFRVGGPEWNSNTSYSLNNTYVSLPQRGQDDFPVVSILGKFYKSKPAWLKPAGYIEYYPMSATKCPNYNFVKAVTGNGVEDFVKINIKAVNNIPYITGSDSKLVWTGKLFKSSTLQLKEGNTYKFKDIMNIPAYGSEDMYGRSFTLLDIFVSNCGMTFYDRTYTKEGSLEDRQTEYGYSLLYAKEGTLMSSEAFSTGYVKVLKGAKDKCKTNFIHATGINNIIPYKDSTKIEFIE